MKQGIKHSSGEKLQKPAIPWRLYLLVGSFMLVIIGVMSYGFYTGYRMSAELAPLADAAMVIKLEATTSHLWFEEIISGDSHESMDIVWNAQDTADWYAKAMLEGDRNQEGEFVPLDDPELRREIMEVRAKLAAFRKITEQRWEAAAEAGIGTEIDQKYDRLFMDLLKQADRVETKLQETISRELISFRNTLIALIALCLLLAILIGTVFYRFERRRAEDFLAVRLAREKTEASEKWLNTTMESMGDAVITTDITGEVTYINPVAIELTGWSLDEARGKNVEQIFNIINEQTRRRAENPVANVLRKGVVVGLANHSVLLSKDGIEYPIADSGAPIIDNEGNLLGVVLVFQNITERKRVMEELKESERKLKEAQQIAHLGCWELDMVSNTLNWSDEIYRIFNLEPREFDASYEAFLNMVHPEDREFVDKAYTDSVKNKTTYDIVHRLLMKNGSVKYVNERCKTEYDENGNPLCSLGTVLDITELKRTEEELQEYRKRLEEKVKKRTEEIEAKNIDLERFNRLFVDREFRIKELREKVKELKKRD